MLFLRTGRIWFPVIWSPGEAAEEGQIDLTQDPSHHGPGPGPGPLLCWMLDPKGKSYFRPFKTTNSVRSKNLNLN